MGVVIVVDIPALPKAAVSAPNAKEDNEEDTNGEELVTRITGVIF